ncbi:hypothetical protein OIO90_002525 [Microbotryomycetes sp. JL221]|nr:hypothetical protein OIO90_002525 [Microbotryomycetes sp. JL221]
MSDSMGVPLYKQEHSTSSTATAIDGVGTRSPRNIDDGKLRRPSNEARGSPSRSWSSDQPHQDLEKQDIDSVPSSQVGSSSILDDGERIVDNGTEKPVRSSTPTALPTDDPDHPVNFAQGKKILINLALNIWVLSLTYTSTAYVASLPALMREFNLSRTAAIVGVTLTVLGFAAGPLLFGPSSEVLGRRPVYVVTGVGYIAFAWGAAFANNAALLLISRFFIGFFGSSAINTVPASIGDFTTLVQRGPFTILYALCAFGGPGLGPLCSAFIETYAGFRWNLRVMAIFITITTIAAAMVPETHAPTILKRKLEKQGQPAPKLSPGKVVGVYKTAMSRPLVYLFTEPIVTIVCMYLSFLYGVLYGFFAAFEVVFVERRGMSLTSFGLTYISLAIGFIIGCALLATVGAGSYKRKAIECAQQGIKTPAEARLTLAYIGAIICPISLFIFAWTAPFTNVHWIGPLIGEMLFGMSMLMVFTGFIPFLVDCYQHTAASALAAGMASRALIGSVFPLFAVQMYHKLTIQWATMLLAFLALMMTPVPFIFKKFGPRLRKASKYANE